MLRKIKNLLFTPTAYVQVFRNRFVVTIPESGIQMEISGDFSHPRMLIGKFVEAEKLLQGLLKAAYGKTLLPQRPRVVVHPKEALEGGLTDIEERVLMEMVLGAGARQVKIWQGEDLSSDALAALKF